VSRVLDVGRYPGRRFEGLGRMFFRQACFCQRFPVWMDDGRRTLSMSSSLWSSSTCTIFCVVASELAAVRSVLAYLVVLAGRCRSANRGRPSRCRWLLRHPGPHSPRLWYRCRRQARRCVLHCRYFRLSGGRVGVQMRERVGAERQEWSGLR